MSNEIEVVYVAMKDDSDEDTTTLISYVNKDDKWIIDSSCFKIFEYYDGKNVKIWK